MHAREVVALALLFSAAGAESAAEWKPERMRIYAERLAARGEYRLAAEEYDRLFAYFPEERANLGLVETMLSLAERSDDLAFAMKLSGQMEREARTGEEGCLGRLYRGRALYKQRRYNKALEAFEVPMPCSHGARQQGRFYSALTLMRLRRWGESESALGGLDSEFAHPDRRDAALALIARAEELRFRSPAVAGGLSAVMPGAGYLYAGSAKSAAAAFLTVGLLAWGAASSFRAGNDGAGTVLTIIATGWHFGGVYGSARAARRYNNYLSDKEIAPLEL